MRNMLLSIEAQHAISTRDRISAEILLKHYNCRYAPYFDNRIVRSLEMIVREKSNDS